VENLPFLRYTTKKSMKILRTGKTIPINTKIVTRKGIKMVIVTAVK
jgi:ribosomal protein L36